MSKQSAVLAFFAFLCLGQIDSVQAQLSLSDPDSPSSPQSSITSYQFDVPCAVGAKVNEQLGNLYNPGTNTPINVQRIQITGAAAGSFSLDTDIEPAFASFPATIAPNSFDYVYLNCEPTSEASELSAQLEIDSDDAQNPHLTIPIHAVQVARPNLVPKLLSVKLLHRRTERAMIRLKLQISNQGTTATAGKFSTSFSLSKPHSPDFLRPVKVTRSAPLNPGESFTSVVRISGVPRKYSRIIVGGVAGKVYAGVLVIQVDAQNEILEGGEKNLSKSYRRLGRNQNDDNGSISLVLN